jgi:hypothetical protein
LPDLNGLARQADNALNERLRGVKGMTEDHNIAAMKRLEMVDKLVYNNRFMIGEQRSHTIALNFHRLINLTDKEEADRGDASTN